MSLEDIGKTVTIEAGESLASAQYYALKLSSGLAVKATADAVVIGFCQNKPASGEATMVALAAAGGSSKAVLGGTVVKGALLVSDSSGNLITRTTENNIVGYALEAGDATNVIEVLMRPMYVA